MEVVTRLARPDPASWNTFDLTGFLPSGVDGVCLDLGCGPGARRDLTERGFGYVGVDRYAVSGADVLGDACALPFGDETFDLVVAASSFEHFPDPWAAAREVARVLKPGGALVASFSFLEPYHARSYFHMSHLGAMKLFSDAGLRVDRLEPFEWTGPEATTQALYQVAPARWLVSGIMRLTLWTRALAIRVLLWHMSDVKKRQRAQEFLEEERFRFTAGIKLRALR